MKILLFVATVLSSNLCFANNSLFGTWNIFSGPYSDGASHDYTAIITKNNFVISNKCTDDSTGQSVTAEIKVPIKWGKDTMETLAPKKSTKALGSYPCEIEIKAEVFNYSLDHGLLGEQLMLYTDGEDGDGFILLRDSK